MQLIYALKSLFGFRPTLEPISLPKIEKLDLDRSIYSPALQNDFLNIPVDRDLLAWRKLSLRFLPETAIPDTQHDDLVEFNSVKCVIPKLADESEVSFTVPSTAEKAEMIESAMRALKKFSYATNGCLRHKEGWWTYELCHMKRIRQFHVITSSDRAEMKRSGKSSIPPLGSIYTEYLLGRFLPNSPDATDVRFGNVFTMKYIDGDRCLTTDRGTCNRSSEVRFVCSENRLTPHFIDIFEDRICHYIIVIGTPALCNIPSFRSWSRPKQSILCIDNASQSTKPNFETAADKENVHENVHENDSKKIKLDKLAELVDTEDAFPLLKQAIMNLLQSEFGAVMPDSLTSHLPRRSLYDVFNELSHAQSKPIEQSSNNVETVDNVNKNSEDTSTETTENTKTKDNVFQIRLEL